MVGIFKRYFEIIAKVAAARCACAATLLPAHKIPEKVFENIAESAAHATEAAGAGAATVFKGSMAILVIGAALLRILQYLIGFVDLFEGGFRIRITGITIRVILHCFLAVGRLEGRGINVTLHLKNFVVINLGHLVLSLNECRPDRGFPRIGAVC